VNDMSADRRNDRSVGDRSPQAAAEALSELLELAVDAFDAWQAGESAAARAAAAEATRAAAAATECLDAVLGRHTAAPDPPRPDTQYP
jgi:hypothetical protein